jgi:hypothetical protein
MRRVEDNLSRRSSLRQQGSNAWGVTLPFLLGGYRGNE